MNLDFYNNKKVLITGHTGFKGSWLCKLLLYAGAKVTGFALEPPTNPSLFKIAGIEKDINSITGDIRNLEELLKSFQEGQPEIVFHLAAQPIVRDSYNNPVYTYETNVIGTVNLLESVRLNPCVKSVVNITTDKVYKNMEWEWGYRENEVLDGFDPYSNSKSCSELVTNSYRNSFFNTERVGVSTARAGNVIGGGDFAKDRIIPDCIRAAIQKEPIIVRNSHSIRPYQYVLEPLYVYLLIAKKQYEDQKYEGSYNVGPEESDCITTGELVEKFCKAWGNEMCWEERSVGGPHEAGYLKLDCSKAKSMLQWIPNWNIDMAICKTVEFTKAYLQGEDVAEYMNKQIREFLN